MLAVLIGHANNLSMQPLKFSTLLFEGTIMQTCLTYSEFCTFLGTYFTDDV